MRNFKRLTAFALVLLLQGVALQSSAYAAGYATLEIGDTGSEVQSMQAALAALGYLNGSADGNFGAKTLEAVKNFQKGNGLKNDGKAGNQTLTALYDKAGTGGSTAAGTASSTSTGGSLAYGDSGSAVQSLQTALTGLGYSTGGTDGKFGNATLKAVKAFQRDNKLTADGKAGTLTQAKLYALAQNGSNATNGSSSESTSSALSHTLTLGSTGTDVDKVQAKLVELKYLANASGTYDNATLAAVKAFQSRNHLTADGITGTKTFNTLFSSTAVAAETASDSTGASTTYTTLRAGASGEAVKALQTQLKSLDYNVDATGTYDSQTAAAVKSFQSRNKLTADGVAGVKTLTLLYSGSAVKYTAPASTSTYSVPSVGEVKLLHWFNDVKPALKGKSSIYVYDPATGISFTLHLYSLGRHADVEPMTAGDTASMLAAFGGKITWTPKFVYVRLPNGVWTAATMHDVAHGGESIKDNNFNGQNCVHFLRDMDEVLKNDPDYGVTNQIALRKGWKELTGEVVN
jgi:peptidoglycan hydrolase-like protein with peptidoglycan-binding domain